MNRKELRKEWRQRHRELGLCVQCNSPAISGRALCEIHRRYELEWRARQRKKGLCRVCRTPAVPPGGLWCQKHRDWNAEAAKASYAERVATGRCASRGCPEMADLSRYCVRHAEMNRESNRRKYKRRVAKAAAYDILVLKVNEVADWWAASCRGESARLPEWLEPWS